MGTRTGDVLILSPGEVRDIVEGMVLGHLNPFGAGFQFYIDFSMQCSQ